ncbi:hypothetical protein D515_04218 [Grimontia indica]|uniref:Uncharacterized protein n=1 Tax=Grimontia indica TaxID=1056512 RepID=R1IV03_9GAMM|nr:hypothetical protein D515_04218 [Grimontia indica]
MLFPYLQKKANQNRPVKMGAKSSMTCFNDSQRSVCSGIQPLE